MFGPGLARQEGRRCQGISPGASEAAKLSQQTKATFDRNARQHEATGNFCMADDGFVNKIPLMAFASSAIAVDCSHFASSASSHTIKSSKGTFTNCMVQVEVLRAGPVADMCGLSLLEFLWESCNPILQWSSLCAQLFSSHPRTHPLRTLWLLTTVINVKMGARRFTVLSIFAIHNQAWCSWKWQM